MNFRHLELIGFQIYAQLRIEASRGFLGIFWWVLEPILFMSAFYVVFASGMRGGDSEFVPFLLSGLIVWKWFASTVAHGANAILANSNLMKQVYVPKYIFACIVLGTNTVKFLFTMAVFLLYLLWSGHDLHVTWIVVPALLLSQALFIGMCSGLASALVPFVPDLRILIDTVLFFLFLISGIFFDIRSLEPAPRKLLSTNPMAIYITSYRSVLLSGKWPDISALSILTAISLLGIGGVYLLIRRFDRHYPKIVP